MNPRRTDRLTFPRWLAAVVLALALAAPATAEPKIQFAELQQRSQKGDDLLIVTWLPMEFWQDCLAAAKTRAQSERMERVLSAVRPYLIVGVIDGKVGRHEYQTFVPEEVLRPRIRAVDSNGHSYPPLADDKISSDVRQLIQVMLPRLAKLRKANEGVHFFLFPARDAEGKEIANAASSRNFDIQLGERHLHWRLPLASVSASKTPGSSQP